MIRILHVLGGLDRGGAETMVINLHRAIDKDKIQFDYIIHTTEHQAYTFDKNTIRALIECSEIRVISDTIANKPYSRWGVSFVPQQSGEVRTLPFEVVTFCYHPNTMSDGDFEKLEHFLEKYSDSFIDFPCATAKSKLSLLDMVLRTAYFMRRLVR